MASAGVQKPIKVYCLWKVGSHLVRSTQYLLASSLNTYFLGISSILAYQLSVRFHKRQSMASQFLFAENLTPEHLAWPQWLYLSVWTYKNPSQGSHFLTKGSIIQWIYTNIQNLQIGGVLQSGCFSNCLSMNSGLCNSSHLFNDYKSQMLCLHLSLM